MFKLHPLHAEVTQKLGKNLLGPRLHKETQLGPPEAVGTLGFVKGIQVALLLEEPAGSSKKSLVQWCSKESMGSVNILIGHP